MMVRKEKGYTIVELMIAVMLFSVVVLAIYSIFTSMQASYAAQDQVVEMQQNVRAAMDTLTRDVQLMGCGLYNGAPDTMLTAANSETAQGTDGITLAGNIAASTILTNDAGNASTILVEDSTGFEDGDTIDICDFNGNRVATGTLSSDPPDKNTLTLASPVSASAGYIITQAYQTLTYTVDYSNPRHPVLRRSGQPLAEDIEDLQFAYVFQDGDEANTPDDTDGDDTNDMEDVRSIRVNLVGRARNQDSKARDFRRPQVEDHEAATSSDGYRRRVLTAEIKARNVR
jgi:type IV pilus assembly protein PilW